MTSTGRCRSRHLHFLHLSVCIRISKHAPYILHPQPPPAPPKKTGETRDVRDAETHPFTGFRVDMFLFSVFHVVRSMLYSARCAPVGRGDEMCHASPEPSVMRIPDPWTGFRVFSFSRSTTMCIYVLCGVVGVFRPLGFRPLGFSRSTLSGPGYEGVMMSCAMPACGCTTVCCGDGLCERDSWAEGGVREGEAGRAQPGRSRQ